MRTITVLASRGVMSRQYHEIRVTYPALEGEAQESDGTTLVLEGQAANIFRLLLERYGVVMRPEDFKDIRIMDSPSDFDRINN